MSDDLVNDNYSDPFIRKIVDFIASDSFQTKFENFFLDHATKFSDKEEHEFYYYELYQQFQEIFDQELLEFCNENSITKEVFYKLCKSAVETDQKANHYIQILISSVEYETFVRLMKIMKPIADIKAKNLQNNNATSGDLKKSKKDQKGDEEDEEEMEEYTAPAESKSSGVGGKSDGGGRGSKGYAKGRDDDDDDEIKEIGDYENEEDDAKQSRK